jgi:hypothetical protein
MIQLNADTFIVAHGKRIVVVKVSDTDKHIGEAEVLDDVTEEFVRLVIDLIPVGHSLSSVNQLGEITHLKCTSEGNVKYQLND